MSRFVMPDYDPTLTKELHAAILSQKVRKVHALLKRHNGSLVYVDDTAYALAKGLMPKQVPRLDEHMRKHFYA